MADRLSANEVVRLAAEAGRAAHEEGLRSGLPVVTADERTGKTYLEQAGRRFEVDLQGSDIRVIAEIGRSDAA
jgi:hypothetical protein